MESVSQTGTSPSASASLLSSSVYPGISFSQAESTEVGTTSSFEVTSSELGISTTIVESTGSASSVPFSGSTSNLVETTASSEDSGYARSLERTPLEVSQIVFRGLSDIDMLQTSAPLPLVLPTILDAPSLTAMNPFSSERPALFFLTFDRNRRDNGRRQIKNKRAMQKVYLVLDETGVVTLTDNCAEAVLFKLNADGTLTAMGLGAYASPAEIANGSSNFYFGEPYLANVQTSFSNANGYLSWSSLAFAGDHQAHFGIPQSGIGSFVVSYNGTIPDGYMEQKIQVLMTSDPAGRSSIISIFVWVLTSHSLLWSIHYCLYGRFKHI